MSTTEIIPSEAELVLARGDDDENGHVTFHLVFAMNGPADVTPEGEGAADSDLDMSPQLWEAIGRPDTVHVYNAD